MMKECATYDDLPAKQSRWEISLRNARDLFLDPATTLLTFRGAPEHRQCKSALGVSPRQLSAKSNRRRICLSGDHGRSNIG
jgi:hypothetical protein